MRLLTIVLLATLAAMPAAAANSGRVDSRQMDEKRAEAVRRRRLEQAELNEARKLLKDHLVDDLLKLALISPDRRLLQTAGIKIIAPNPAGRGAVAFPERRS